MTYLYGSETEDHYSRAGFGSRARRGDHPALLVVDLTNGFTDSSYASSADLDAVVRETTRLCDAAHFISAPVVFTSIAYTAEELTDEHIVWLDKVPGMRVMLEGTPAVKIDQRLPMGTDDSIVFKKGASAFFGTRLAETLREQGVNTIVICGATTSGCIRASAVDAVQAGFSVLVPRECVGDRAAGPHEANLFDIDAKYGDVIGVQDVLDYFADLQDA
ncbi:MAG TPA: carbamoylsarcosine amidase [Chloroflexi bacterium]|jgi:nicotinamidase-related amidase|nr:carbamoylsarcosine amidase [Chloroflexota bacterium]